MRDPSPPPATVAVAIPTPAPPLPAPKGRLLVDDWQQGLSICSRSGESLEATCTKVELPGPYDTQRLFERDVPGRYFIPMDTGAAKEGVGLWDAKTGALTPFPGVAFERYTPLVRLLEDGSLIHYEHLSNFSRVLRAPRGGRFTAISALDALRGYGFRFSDKGSYLFKRTPGMGGHESPYYIDVIPGSSTALYHADSIDSAPKRIATRDQFMEPGFVDEGRTIAYFRPGSADEAKNERTFLLETVDVATGTHASFDTIALPLQGSDFGHPVYYRGAPPIRFFTHGPWVLHGTAHDARGEARILRAQNVLTRESTELSLEGSESLFPTLPSNGEIQVTPGQGDCPSPYFVTCEAPNYGSRHCTVRAVPSFDRVMTVTLSERAAAADWLED